MARFRIPEGKLPTAQELVDQAGELLGSPLRLCYVDSAAYSGSLLGTEDGTPLIVTVNRSYRGSGPVEILVVGHELGHALGLDGAAVAPEPMPTRIDGDQVPDLPEGLLRSLLVLRTRCGTATRPELACEYFGALLVSRCLPVLESRAGSETALRADLPGLEASMGGRRLPR